ncbi:MAG: hypothetical protein AB8F74_13610 [Saprospiraceae bacterium]
MKSSLQRGSFLLMIVFILSFTVSCKSSKKKNKCNTCPTWDQVDVPEDAAE